MTLTPEEIIFFEAAARDLVLSDVGFTEKDIPAIMADFERGKLTDEEWAEIVANAVDEVPLSEPPLFNWLHERGDHD